MLRSAHPICQNNQYPICRQCSDSDGDDYFISQDENQDEDSDKDKEKEGDKEGSFDKETE